MGLKVSLLVLRGNLSACLNLDMRYSNLEPVSLVLFRHCQRNVWYGFPFLFPMAPFSSCLILKIARV